jgi:hypothetical protein
MPRTDWMAHYPQVAKLLQQPDEVLDYTVEEEEMETPGAGAPPSPRSRPGLGRYLCTPRKALTLPEAPDSERARFYISARDHAQLERGHPWRATVQDLDTGVLYTLEGAPCRLACFCDAVIVAVSNPA